MIVGWVKDVVRAGKHKGTKYEDIETSCLIWMAENIRGSRFQFWDRLEDEIQHRAVKGDFEAKEHKKNGYALTRFKYEPGKFCCQNREEYD